MTFHASASALCDPIPAPFAPLPDALLAALKEAERDALRLARGLQHSGAAPEWTALCATARRFAPLQSVLAR